MIVGPGAVGSMLASNFYLSLDKGAYPFKIRLGGSKQSSCFTKKHLEEIKRNVLYLKTDSNLNFYTKPQIDFVPSLEKADFVIFAVKIFDLLKASENYFDSISSSSVILVVSNGIDAFEKINKKIHKKKLFRGLIETGCELNEPGKILQHGEAKIEISPNDSGLVSRNNDFEMIKFFFENAGFAVSTSKDSHLSEWKKFMANCLINPLATLFNCENGKIVDEPILDIFFKLASELQQLVDSEKLPIDVNSRVFEFAKNTSSNQNSMLKSFLNGKKSELQEMTGEVLRLAGNRKLHLPLNNFLFSALKIIEDKNKM